MIDQLSLGVADLDRAAALYDAALGALGYVRLAQNTRSVCYGPPGFTGEAPFAILHVGPSANPANRGMHLARVAPNRAAVDDFHAAALRHGAIDEGHDVSAPTVPFTPGLLPPTRVVIHR